MSVSQLAQRKGLIQLSNRSLNAINAEGRCLRLVEYPSHDDKDLFGLLNESIDFCVALERNYPGNVDDKLPSWKENFAWAHVIVENSRTTFSDLYVWTDFLENHIQPTLAVAFPLLTANGKHLGWASRYQLASQQMFERYTWMLEHNDFIDKKSLIEKLNSSAISEMPKLSWKSFQACLSTNIDSVVVGMRSPQQVLDIVSFIKQFSVQSPIKLQHLEQLFQLQFKEKK